MTDVHVVAVGARTPLGLTAESSIAAVRAGISRVSEHPFLIDRAAEPVRMAQDSLLDPGMMGPERLVAMAATALEDVARQVAPEVWELGKVPLLLCLPEERPGWSDDAVRALRSGMKRTIPFGLRSVESYSYGHAGGVVALEVACRSIRTGRAALSVILGVDSYLQLNTLEWLDANRQLATSYHRSAFFPGEAAGAVVVASDEIVRRYNMESLAIVRGTGVAAESCLIKTDAICVGEGLTASVRKALSSLRLPDQRVEGIICDINGEKYRVEEWGFVLLRLPEAFVDATDYESPASCWGDVGAASGPLFVGMAVQAGRRRWAKGSRYLIWTSAEHGARATALLEVPLQSEEVWS